MEIIKKEDVFKPRKMVIEISTYETVENSLISRETEEVLVTSREMLDNLVKQIIEENQKSEEISKITSKIVIKRLHTK